MDNKIKKVVILGGGESGCGSAVLAKKVGLEVFLSDKGVLEPKYTEILDQYGVDYEQGIHTLDKILSADVVVKSPGIPDSVEIIKSIKAKGIKVVSELEFAKPYSNAKTICITGSNGKTTTTTLIYDILKNGGFNVGLGGNIGKSYAMQVACCQHDWYVLEISSFQLDGMFDFKADISVLTNITPDHLDRYDYKMENYVRSKFRVCNNQTAEDSFVYCADDAEMKEYMESVSLNASKVSYSVQRSDTTAWLNGDIVNIKVGDNTLAINRNDIYIKGLHNVSNVMASALASLLAGVDPQAVRSTIESFKGVEHRVEMVCCDNNILYINDSKATNVDAVWYALESMTRPVVWIAGGTDKGNDYTPLLSLAKDKVHTLICMGLDNEKLIASFGDIIPDIYDTGSLEDAMCAVMESAKSGDVVLLSPACASFDLFNNYEHRGELFKAAVIELIKK